MRRAIVVCLALLVVVGAGIATRLILDEDLAPLPTSEELQRGGFAVWPEDTLDEGLEACDKADAWQLDPQGTAFRFAREVLDYPDPQSSDPVSFEGDPKDQMRFLVGGPDTDLGSVIDVRKYDRCWFVVNLEPRESGYLPSIGFVHTPDRTRIVLSSVPVNARIGFGRWEEEIAGSRSQGQVILDPPKLPSDATGSIMSISSAGKVKGGSAAPLGFIPQPATAPTTPLDFDEVLKTPRICRRDDAWRHPSAALYDLFTFTFDSGARAMRGREVIYRRGSGAEHLGGDRWRLTVNGTKLAARIPKIEKGCWRVLTINEDSPPILKSLQLDPGRLTFDLNWGRATSAEITVSTSRVGSSWRFEKIQQPLTVRTYEDGLLDEPMEVTVVLRAGRRVILAQRSWYHPGV